MSARIVAPGAIWSAAWEHLSLAPERVCFLLAQYQSAARTFEVFDWRPVASTDDGGWVVELDDLTRAGVVAWATDQGACLVEAHSHGGDRPPAFSKLDLEEFDEWVPHVRWRLGGRPYAAIVTSSTAIDALAWTTDTGAPEAVTALEADTSWPASGSTIRSMEAGS